MSVIPVTLARSTAGPTTNPTEAVAIFAVLATANGGAVDTPTLIRNDADPAAIFDEGPLVEACSAISGYSRQATIAVRVTTATPGAYEAIDLTDFTGTMLPAVNAAVVPTNDSEAYVIFTEGGTLGTPGVAYKWSLDNGRTLSARVSLGAAVSITFPEGGIGFTLGLAAAQVTALVTLVAELRTDRLAHYALGVATHNAADVTSGVGIGAAPTDLATAIARVNQIRAADLLHAANAPTVHNAADATSYVGCPAAAATGPEAVALAIFLKTAGNAHNAIAPSVHDTADAANDITAADPVQATIVTGDIIRVATTAPAADVDGITSALAALADYTGTVFGGLVIKGAFDPDTLWTPLINGIDALRERQRPVLACIEARLPTDAETETAYRLALEDEYENLYDERVYVAAGSGRYDTARLAQLEYEFTRTHLVPFVARLAALDFGESPGVVDPTSGRAPGIRPSAFGGRIDGYRIVDDAGTLIGHDERIYPGLQESGFGVMTSYPLESPTDAFSYEPLTRAEPGNTAPHVGMQRTVNVIEQVIYFEGTRLVQSKALLEPGRTTIRSGVADQIDGKLTNAVFAAVGDPNKTTSARISSFTFEIDRAANITAVPTRLPFTATVQTGRYISGLDGNLQVNQGV